MCEYSQRGHWKVLASSAVFSGWTRTLHKGALHWGQSGRPLVLSNEEWPRPVSGIFRLQKGQAKAQLVSPPPDAFNEAKPDRPALIKIL
jgi:hypothetical protein